MESITLKWIFSTRVILPCFLCFTLRYLYIWCCLIDRIFLIAVCFQSKYLLCSSETIVCTFHQLNTFNQLNHKHTCSGHKHMTPIWIKFLVQMLWNYQGSSVSFLLTVTSIQCSLIVSKSFLHSSNSFLVRQNYTYGNVMVLWFLRTSTGAMTEWLLQAYSTTKNTFTSSRTKGKKVRMWVSLCLLTS